MKGCSGAIIEQSFAISTVDALEQVEFCISQLYADTRRSLDDDVVKDCTFEELITALLAARAEIAMYRREEAAIFEDEQDLDDESDDGVEWVEDE